MKVVIDISPPLYERAQRALSEGRYSSLGQLASVALENQLVLEAQEEHEIVRPSEPALPPAPPARAASVGSARAFADLSIVGEISQSTGPRSDAAERSVSTAGWVWGIINRVLPIKVAARSLLIGGPAASATLEQCAELSALRAQAFAKWISDSYGSAPPAREDSILTGLPSREPLYKARQRFADFFFGREDKKGNAWGALFELGLATTEERSKKTYPVLTLEGRSFAALPNPVIDSGDLSTPLSVEEIEMYLRHVVLRVPREGRCFQALLEALEGRERAVEELSNVATRALPNDLTDAAVSTMKIGALGRMLDLGLVSRRKVGRSARFVITEGGTRALSDLRQHARWSTTPKVEAQA